MKLSLQILDRGETFYRALEDDPIHIGASDDAEVRLTDAGVAPLHARIETLADGSHRLVDLGAPSGTRVNGEDVAQCRLAVGDRIEIGASVLVVGQQVVRPVTAADVLADDRGRASLAAGIATGRARRIRDGSPRRPVGLLVGVVAALLGTVGVWWWATSQDALPVGWGDLQRALRDGRVADAQQLVDRFRAEWVDGDPERAASVEFEAARVAALDAALAELRAAVVEAVPHTSRNDQLEQLRMLERGDAPTAVAARILLSQLDELRYEQARAAASDLAVEPSADRVATERPDRSPDRSEARPDAQAADAGGGAMSAGSADRTSAVVTADEIDAEPSADAVAAIDAARAAAAEERFAEADERLRAALAEASRADAAVLLDARSELRSRARTAMDVLMQRARAVAGSGDLDAVDRELVALRDAAARFPVGSDAEPLRREIAALDGHRRRLREAIAAAPAGRGASAVDIAGRLAMVQAAERDGDFALAARRLDEIVGVVQATDPGYASTLAVRAAGFDALGALLAWLQSGDRSTEGLFDADFGLEAAVRSWRQADPAPAVLMGAAALAYRRGERPLAEDLLADALRADRELAPRIHLLLAGGRGESADPDGYRLVDGAFVAARELRVAKRAKELEQEIAGLLRGGESRRERGLEALLAKGPDDLESLVVALRHQAAELVERIRRDPFERYHAKVAELRERLDGSRRDALELIFDTDRYFYPYKPPAVTGERAAEYAEVQAEVDRRVAAVRDLWDAEARGRRPGRSLVDALGQLEWLLGVLLDLGESTASFEADIEWARALPADEPLTLRNFARTRAERAELDHAKQIDAYNESFRGEIERTEWAVVENTNRYRALLGRMPLVIDIRLMEAARAHAAEMSDLGYFSHHSPTPGRKTPFDRMRSSGYGEGASENIALYSSAEGAHNGWTHSSGHHRNLLSSGNIEIGVGHTGRNWVQNFGRGASYRDRSAFAGR